MGLLQSKPKAPYAAKVWVVAGTEVAPLDRRENVLAAAPPRGKLRLVVSFELEDERGAPYKLTQDAQRALRASRKVAVWLKAAMKPVQKFAAFGTWSIPPPSPEWKAGAPLTLKDAPEVKVVGTSKTGFQAQYTVDYSLRAGRPCRMCDVAAHFVLTLQHSFKGAGGMVLDKFAASPSQYEWGFARGWTSPTLARTPRTPHPPLRKSLSA